MKQNKEPANEYQEGPGFTLSVKPPYGNGAGTEGQVDELGYTPRPLTFDAAKAKFKADHPEFSDQANVGDWTSYKFTNKI